LEIMIKAFDPDEGMCESFLTEFQAPGQTFLEAEQTAARFWLRWDSGRRPLQPPIDVPTPPPLSRPWLGGTLYEWPEHAALFGATPD
jgi:hypothetical protein